MVWPFKPRAPITRRSWINLGFAVGLLALLAIYAARSGGQVSDRVDHVLSGDTLVVGATKIALRGIAVPEVEETAVEEPAEDAAKRFLSNLVLGRVVTCVLTGERAWDRIYATCTLDGKDLGQALVEAGLARDCPRQSEGRYAAFETEKSVSIPLPEVCALD
jgi:endonuclease YncB( thermonuclease family)